MFKFDFAHESSHMLHLSVRKFSITATPYDAYVTSLSLVFCILFHTLFIYDSVEVMKWSLLVIY